MTIDDDRISGPQAPPTRSCAFRYEPDHNCLVLRWTGPLDGDFMLTCLEQVVSGPTFRPEMNLFHDYRQAWFSGDFRYHFIVERFRWRVQAVDAKRNPALSAHLAGRPVDFGVLRMLIQIMDTFEVAKVTRKCFLDLDEALAWLRLPEDFRPEAASDADEDVIRAEVPAD
ncbi:MAG: hypothetical protein H6906_01215 [Hyphomicrobiales bacterium]|nr:hypothetical protein [Hyphomicrobiales bacterium]